MQQPQRRQRKPFIALPLNPSHRGGSRNAAVRPPRLLEQPVPKGPARTAGSLEPASHTRGREKLGVPGWAPKHKGQQRMSAFGGDLGNLSSRSMTLQNATFLRAGRETGCCSTSGSIRSWRDPKQEGETRREGKIMCFVGSPVVSRDDEYDDRYSDTNQYHNSDDDHNNDLTSAWPVWRPSRLLPGAPLACAAASPTPLPQRGHRRTAITGMQRPPRGDPCHRQRRRRRQTARTTWGRCRRCWHWRWFQSRQC